MLLLAACGGPGESPEKVMATARAEDRVIACRRAGAQAFADDCTLEWRAAGDGGGQARLLVLRHKHGGFHRLLLSADGRLGQADGGEPLKLESDDGQSLTVALAGDHYRFRKDQLEAVK